MTNFEEHLRSYLIEEHGADQARSRHPEARHPRRRPLLLGSLAASSTAAVAVGVTLLVGATSATSPAYALTSNANGSYTLTFTDLTTGIPAINAKLKELGIPATVVPVQAGCTASSFDPVQDDQIPGSTSTTFTQAGIPAGWREFIAAEPIPGSKLVRFAQGTTPQPIPSCFPTTTSHGIPVPENPFASTTTGA